MKHQLYTETICLARGIAYYDYVRGYWNQKPPLYLIQAQAAQALGDTVEEILSLSLYTQTLCKQGDQKAVNENIERLRQLTVHADLPSHIRFEVMHTHALYHLIQNDPYAALFIWKQALRIPHLQIRESIAGKRWIALCLYRQSRLRAAQRLFRHALQDAERENYVRTIIAIRAELAKISIDLKDIAGAECLLEQCKNLVSEFRESRHTAELHYTYARFHILCSNLTAAHAALTEAIDLYERLGMRRELAETRQELADLETRMHGVAEEHALPPP